MHARAAARFVHAATAFRSRVRVMRGNRVTDGKSIMGILLLAASRGTALIDHGGRAGRARGARSALQPRGDRPWRGSHAAPEGRGRHRRASPAGRAVLLTHRGQAVRFPMPGGAGRAGGRTPARSRAIDPASSCRASPARISRGPGSDLAPLFEAQLLILDDPMLIERASRSSGRNGSTRSGPCAARSRRSSTCSTASKIPTCASARATSRTSSAACA